jgi:primary-amine oxidase
LCWAWIATIGNYEYGFNWVFHQDGTLEMEVMLSGFVETKALQSTENRTKHSADSYSHLLVGNLAGVHHQHFFNFRLDMDVDDAANSVVEQNGEPTQASPANPYGNAFTMKETLLRKEQEAQRLIDLYSSRTWKVINPSQANALGQAVGYTLVGGENSLPFAQPDSWIRKGLASSTLTSGSRPTTPLRCMPRGGYWSGSSKSVEWPPGLS